MAHEDSYGGSWAAMLSSGPAVDVVKIDRLWSPECATAAGQRIGTGSDKLLNDRKDMRQYESYHVRGGLA